MPKEIYLYSKLKEGHSNTEAVLEILSTSPLDLVTDSVIVFYDDTKLSYYGFFTDLAIPLDKTLVIPLGLSPQMSFLNCYFTIHKEYDFFVYGNDSDIINAFPYCHFVKEETNSVC